jgi:hypothetical protein
MKKKNLKVLNLNKTAVSNLHSVKGGLVGFESTNCSINLCGETDNTGPFVDTCISCVCQTDVHYTYCGPNACMSAPSDPSICLSICNDTK